MTQLNPKQVKHRLRRAAKESSSGLLVFKSQLLQQIDGKLGEYHSGHLHRETALAEAEQIKWGSEQLILTRLQEEPVLISCSDPAMGGYAAQYARELTPSSLRNGLSDEENALLFSTTDVSACISVLFERLAKLKGGAEAAAS